MASNLNKIVTTSVVAFIVGMVIPVYSTWSIQQAQATEEQQRHSVVQAIQKLYSIPYVSHHLPG